MTTTLKQLKAAYKNAVEKNEETFTLDGCEYFVDYAQYMIRYLETYKMKDSFVLNVVQENI